MKTSSYLTIVTRIPLRLADLFLHEYIFKNCLPRYKLKAESLEASNHVVDCFLRTMAPKELNRNDMVSLIWDTVNDNIKYEISAFDIIRLERKKGKSSCAFKMETLEFEHKRIHSQSCIDIRKVFST